ncbi:MAG: hypothetical protein M0Q91_11860 [Methanoregula sp.]|jgi:hypothetical protein|nr:hypothetical protein [Methanoregula sp.]
MKFTVITETDKRAVCDYLAKLPDGKQFIIEIAVKREKRTLSQNSLYWLWLACIEAETGNDKNILHHEFGNMYLPRISGELNGRPIESPVSTKALNTMQFKNYLDRIQTFAAAELGIRLPDPEDLIIDSFVEMYKDRA